VSTLSRREAALRAAATACLAGIALLQAIELPSLLVQGGWPVLPSAAATAVCLGLCLALVVAPAGVSRQVWRVVAATAALILAGWALPHSFALPDLAEAPGDWAAMPGVACAAAGVTCLALAAAAVRPGRATTRGLATALAVLVAGAPGIGALLVAVGPGPAGGEAALAADVHVHAHLTAPESDIRFRPAPNGNHYLTSVAVPVHPPATGVALLAAAALVLVGGGIAHLLSRSTPAPAGIGPRAEGRLT
jgi:hypothetical protein